MRMSTRLLLVSTVALGAGLPGTSLAQTPPYPLLPVLTRIEEAGALRLQIVFMNNPQWATAMWSATPDGIDLYRRQMGFDCSSFERINSEPIAWSWNDGMTIEVVDATTSPGNVYEYLIHSVPSTAENPDVIAGHVTHGEALIGHGDILRTVLCPPYRSQRARTCEQECFPAVQLTWGPDLEPYVNTGQPLALYGWIDGTGLNTCSDAYVTWGSVTRAEPRTCLLAVEAATWTAAKRLYQ